MWLPQPTKWLQLMQYLRLLLQAADIHYLLSSQFSHIHLKWTILVIFISTSTTWTQFSSTRITISTTFINSYISSYYRDQQYTQNWCHVTLLAQVSNTLMAVTKYKFLQQRASYRLILCAPILFHRQCNIYSISIQFHRQCKNYVAPS